MARISNKLIGNLATIFCRTLDRPTAPYVDNQAVVGNIWAGDTGGYGYAVEETINGNGGVRRLASGLTASEAYHWLQGALETARLLGADGPIADRWTGTRVHPSPYGALVRYVSPTDRKGSRWGATIMRDGTAYRAYVPFQDGPILAAMAAEAKVAAEIDAPSRKPISVIYLTPDSYAVGF
jgi:hypothetical protein